VRSARKLRRRYAAVAAPDRVGLGTQFTQLYEYKSTNTDAKGAAGVEEGVQQGVARVRVPQGSVALEQVEAHCVEMSANTDERPLNLYATNQPSPF
jgi:hypothetical protein